MRDATCCMAVLVTGAAGYIGSVTVEALRTAGEEVVALDNLSRGHRAAVPSGVPLHVGNVGDCALVARIVREHGIESCIHFAAFAYVGESVSDPALYFENNVAQGLELLRALVEAGVKQVVFSSSCAVYGAPRKVPISEDHPLAPISPYGWTKFVLERALESFERAYALRFVALRYFNAAGATERCGECHEPEPHLIPNVLLAASGRIPHVRVFGTDYPTPDGTAIRDYIHVCDLAEAHLRAVRYLRGGGRSEFLNLGTGRGYSVREVIEKAEQITGRTIPQAAEARRDGDPASLSAECRKARALLGWEPTRSNLDHILESAWNWHQKQEARKL